MRRWPQTLVFLLLVACEGRVGELPAPIPSAEVDSGTPETNGVAACDPAMVPADLSLETIASEFATNVYPIMNSATSEGCVSCHAPASHRALIVSGTGTDTFHQIHAAGLFKNQAGSLLARMTTTDALLRMPQGQAAWPQDHLAALANIACEVEALDARGGPAADETFPSELLTPYSGVANTNYDNTFINYVQLKARVKAVFNDDWVRAGVDTFDKNIGLFGGVNFRTNFVEARAATTEFLTGLDTLAPDICGKAVTAATGPFAGMTLTTELVDIPASTTQLIEAETMMHMGGASAVTNPAGFRCSNNCLLTQNVTLTAPGTYQLVIRGKATLAGGIAPQVESNVGSAHAAVATFTSTAAFEDKTVSVAIPNAGVMSLGVQFTNDSAYVDDAGVSTYRSVTFDSVKVVGPIGGSTGTTRETAARQNIGTLYSRMLYRPATTIETDNAYALLKDVAQLDTTSAAWAGLCKALVNHPDFLFTLPPYFDTSAASEKDRLRLVALAQRLLGRPPTPAEFTRLGANGFPAMVDEYLASPDFQKYYMNRMQLRLESSGSTEADEPARLWTYLATTGTPFDELFTGDYGIDAQFAKQPRPAEHGKSGLLTMKGYIASKPGLPHYNYPARVMSGFMGSVFEVPPEVFEQRIAATATSTVDPTSICYQCHQVLTPLAHQRLKWADDGTFRSLDEQGQPIDDSDRGLVTSYPYKGAGLEAFSIKAVRKEAFIRRMINAQFKLLIGRDLRHLQDERVLYKQLWDNAVANHNSLPSLLRAIALSDAFQRPTP